MEMNFCRRCGTALHRANETAYVCQKNHTIFLNPAAGVGIFFFDHKGSVILSVRAFSPHKGKLDSFGGFVDVGENLEQTLTREIREELQLSPDDYTKPTYLTSVTSTYKYGNELRPVFSVLYYAQLHPGASPVPSDDVASLYYAKPAEVKLKDFGGSDAREGFRLLREFLLSGKISPS